MKFLFSKILTFWIFLKKPLVPSQQRWFIRFRYFGWLNQLRYFYKDYIVRKPYKVISFKGEFQQELLHVLPFAYWHYKNGTLLRTESSEYSKELYWFSPVHIEKPNLIRDYKDNENIEIPNGPHDTKLLKIKWKKVPLKEQYLNEFFKFDKQIVVIANRYNTEWKQDPITYFSLNDLDDLIGGLKHKYQIIYNRPPANKISEDNSDVLDLDDERFIKENHPEVLFLPSFDFSKIASNYNHLQCMVYANCERFVSIHGGTATLASYFGGTNVIYSRKGHEHPLGEFTSVFPEVSGAKIFLNTNVRGVLKDIHKLY